MGNHEPDNDSEAVDSTFFETYFGLNNLESEYFRTSLLNSLNISNRW